MKAARLAALGAAILFGASVAATAQPPVSSTTHVTTVDSTRHRGAGRQRRGRQAGRALLRGVNLTDAQKSQVQQIQQKYAGQRRALAQQLRPSGQAARPDSAARAAFRTQARALMEQQVTEVRGVLTADQQKAFDANVASFRAHAKAHQGKHARRDA
jgi:Spy/CpxP family protein refolding chaperone